MDFRQSDRIISCLLCRSTRRQSATHLGQPTR